MNCCCGWSKDLCLSRAGFLKAKRNKVVFVALTCPKQTCFCTLAQFSLGPRSRSCSSQAGLQWTDGFGLKRAHSRCRDSPALSGCRSKAVEPASLTYLEAEEDEELFSFRACKIQCRKVLASDILSS